MKVHSQNPCLVHTDSCHAGIFRQSHEFYVFRDLRVRETLIVVTDSDALVESFVNRFTQSVLKIGFPTEDKCKTVEGIISIIHEHFYIVEDTGIQILCFVYGKKKRLAFFLVKIVDLILCGTEHPGLTAFVTDTENLTEFLVKIRDTYRGKADIFHVVHVWIEVFGKAA